MTSVKNMLNKLWVVLAVAGVASAASVWPLQFGETAPKNAADSATQQKYWDKLMTFKMWGTEGITMGHASTPDSNGAIGTAINGMTLYNGEHNLGGPIYVGGGITFGDGPDAFLSGPVRVTENFASGQNTNSFYGTYCIEGSATKANGKDLAKDFARVIDGKDSVLGRLFQGASATTGACSYDSVPAVPEYLSIPTVPASTDLGYGTVIDVVTGDFVVSGTKTIDVPNIKIVGTDTLKMYDLYINGDIVLQANSKLYIRMESPRSLLRIFLNGTVDAASSSQIQVVYVDSLAQYVGTTWTNVTEPKYVDNKEYAGNVLFHCKKDIDWSSMNGESFFQGSFLTTGTLKVGSNLVLAGQLLGNKLDIGHDFKGDDFRYVPFDPPVLNTAQGVKTYLVEGHEKDSVKIALDKEATTLIDFEYCFAFDGVEDGKDPNGLAARGDIITADIPLYNGTACENPGKAYFDVGSKNLRTPIILTAKNDGVDEGTDSKPGKETFRIIIQNLNAATLKDGSHDGYITLEISDPDLLPLKFAKDTLKAIDENPNNDAVIDTLRALHGTVACSGCKYVLSDTSHYSDFITLDEDGVVRVKDSTKFDFETVEFIDIQVHVTDVDNNMDEDTTIIIPINNVNEDPILDKQEFDIDEHLPAGTRIDSLKWGEHDSLPAYRQDVFVAISDTTFVTVTPDGIIKTKKELDYETMDTTYILVVKLVDATDPTLFDIDTMVIHVHNVNEQPVITTDTLHVTENSKKGTVVGVVEATDPDLNDTKTFVLEKESECFEIATDGTVKVKKDGCLDREKSPVDTITVKVTDAGGLSHTKKVVIWIDDVPGPTIEVTDTNWVKPKEPIYTNEDDFRYCWILNSAKDDENCADTLLHPGENPICKTVCDVDGFEGCATDCITVYYSDLSPVVTIDAGGEANLASNIYTIVEQPADGDTSVYVRDSVRTVKVYITDYDYNGNETRDTLVFEKVDITKQVAVPQKTYDILSSVSKQTVALDELNPNTVKTPINGTDVLNSYTTKVSGIEVTVSYVTDSKGNVVKQAVVNEKGKVDSIEVITVSYETVVDGKTVTVSYQADATTGKALNVDGNGGFVNTKKSDSSSGIFKVSYDYVDPKTGKTLQLTYVVDRNGNLVKNPEGDRGYQMSYTYVDKYGNVGEQAVFVVLDQTLPKVEILYPVEKQVIRSNFVKVQWTIDGVEQDTLVLQGLEKGANVIVRFYKDKAGNEAYDSVIVIMKDSKDIDISVEQPVTVITKDKVDEYYAVNPPKKGETFAVSVRNPSTEEEVETLIGGSFKTKSGSGEEPYPGVKGTKHLGPTLALDVKLPTVSGVGGLATLDDLILPNGRISNKGIGIDTANLDSAAKSSYKEYTVEEYVSQFCEDGTEIPSDYSKFNLYNITLKTKVWVYTSLGNFVNEFSFTQEFDNPDYANEAGLTQMFFEMKPDKDGYVHAKNKKLMATGAYVYKVEAQLKNHLRCSIPPFDGINAKSKGDEFKSNDDLLKPFGYKRPSYKKK